MLELILNIEIGQAFFIFLLSIFLVPFSTVVLISSCVVFICNNFIKLLY